MTPPGVALRGDGARSPSSPLPPGAHERDYSTAGYCSMLVGDVRDYGYRIGAIATPHGMVRLYDQVGRDNFKPMTSLDVVAGGRVYSATWRRTFSNRFLKTLASRFAASVAARATGPASPHGNSGRTPIQTQKDQDHD